MQVLRTSDFQGTNYQTDSNNNNNYLLLLLLLLLLYYFVSHDVSTSPSIQQKEVLRHVYIKCTKENKIEYVHYRVT